MIMHDPNHPLGEYFDAVQDAGFLMEPIVGPMPDDAYVALFPEAARWLEPPGFLHVRVPLGR
jgi:hypothetical protein